MAVFKKIYIFLILFSIFFSVNSYSEVVKKVDVQGNDRISQETIMIFGDIEIGKNYEQSDIGLLIKKLYMYLLFLYNVQRLPRKALEIPTSSRMASNIFQDL